VRYIDRRHRRYNPAGSHRGGFWRTSVGGGTGKPRRKASTSSASITVEPPTPPWACGVIRTAPTEYVSGTPG